MKIAVTQVPEAKGPRTIERFETGETTWPQDLDVRIRAYADALDIEPIDIWREAIKRWAAVQSEGQASEAQGAMSKSPPPLQANPEQSRQEEDG